MNREKIIGPFERAARKRWPDYSVTGEGPVAAVNTSLHSVHLFQFELLAQDYVAEIEGRGMREYLTMYKLQPDYCATFNSNNGRPLRVSADTMERERHL